MLVFARPLALINLSEHVYQLKSRCDSRCACAQAVESIDPSIPGEDLRFRSQLRDPLRDPIWPFFDFDVRDLRYALSELLDQHRTETHPQILWSVLNHYWSADS